ncbi:MAG TPA: hypothetical protein VFE47_31620 [Tepidisphaeraceae bacterium]|jgi:hypothetical protein|nr:hypothetical protein [Tepidisphaeraceae bacterium]
MPNEHFLFSVSLDFVRFQWYDYTQASSYMVAIHAHFDGKVIVPDEPLDLPTNTRLVVHLESEDRADSSEDKFETPKAVPDDDMAWTMGIAHEWRAELSDPREDIYTIEDGEPIDGTR